MSPPSLPPHLFTNSQKDFLLSQSHSLPSLPDLLLTALSITFLFSTSRPIANLSFTRCPFLSFPSNTRRFLKIPTMSVTATPQKTLLSPPRRHNFPSPQSLSDWLEPRLPSESFASWGVKPGTKNVHNLWIELSAGETSLADSSPPVRTVQVVTLRVLDKENRILIESHQELSDGNVRKRGRPLSEKMKPNEDPESAAVRAVKEELGSLFTESADDLDFSEVVRIEPNSYGMKVEERDSASYPGLPGCYVVHTMDARIDSLPDEDFCTYEIDEYKDSEDTKVADKAVSVKKHFWKWVNPDTDCGLVFQRIKNGGSFSTSRYFVKE